MDKVNDENDQNDENDENLFFRPFSLFDRFCPFQFAKKCSSKGIQIIWDVDLGLFDRLQFPLCLRDSARLCVYFFSIDKYLTVFLTVIFIDCFTLRALHSIHQGSYSRHHVILRFKPIGCYKIFIFEISHFFRKLA